ncbi:MAG: polysaccharide deacetylase family protein [Rhodospirillales bacterium]|jgi:hypothetical protein|nr:polysaccharide deacetylase family protein [Rhodospirillales bacterium]MDP6883713.1 polysaccharide deacetylase family protein [Rhodospirillales bacterium]
MGKGTAAGNGWRDLEEELDAWADGDRAADLWWRDDDARGPTPALRRLLALSDETSIPLTLAVVPLGTEIALAQVLEAVPGVKVIQHGYAHVNHGGADGKKAELAAGRPAEEALGELIRGRRRLTDLFDGRFHAVLAPPWNRIDPLLVPALPGAGFRGLSAFGARQSVEPAPGLIQGNCHVDIVDWRGSRGFVGEEAALAAIVDHLAWRRRCEADAEEATGILTHHLVMDDACWAFLATLMARTQAHRAVRWLDVEEALWLG